MNGVRHRFVIVVLFIAIMVTIITQLPFFIEHDLNILGTIVWVPLLLCLFFLNAIKVNICIYFPIICFLGYSLLLLLFNSLFYVSPMISCIKGFAISISMFLVGYFLANILKERQFIEAVVYAALIGGIAYVVILKSTVFYVIDLDSITYLYKAKNSASKIIFTCSILVLFLYIPRYKVTVCLKYLTFLLFICMILIMKSRSTILALTVPVFIVLFYGKNKDIKKYTYMFLFIVILLCVCSILYRTDFQ